VPVVAEPQSPARATAAPPAADEEPQEPDEERPSISPELEAKLDEVRTRLSSGDPEGAEEQLRGADELAGDDFAAKLQVAWTRSTLLAYRDDYEGAAGLLRRLLPEARQRPDDPAEFWIHNTLMMIREAQGDIPAALVENDAMTLAGRRGTWERVGDVDRPTMVALKDEWHRAYLLRMLAAQLDGSRREATLQYAEAARARYAELAGQLEGYGDSVAVLEGYFAALDGDAQRALAAARRVDVPNNGDAEDLYLTVGSFVAGGDEEAAEHVREKLRNPGFIYIAVPIMLDWIERDRAARNPRRARFTPFHPTGRP
jgi:ATP/maltotriose-dependent transcriptional regulator MalT